MNNEMNFHKNFYSHKSQTLSIKYSTLFYKWDVFLVISCIIMHTNVDLQFDKILGLLTYNVPSFKLHRTKSNVWARGKTTWWKIFPNDANMCKTLI